MTGLSPADAPPAAQAAAILTALRGRFRLDDETALQGQIHAALVAAGFPAEREVRLGPADRIGLMVGPGEGTAVGVEVRIKGPRRAIYANAPATAATGASARSSSSPTPGWVAPRWRTDVFTPRGCCASLIGVEQLEFGERPPGDDPMPDDGQERDGEAAHRKRKGRTFDSGASANATSPVCFVIMPIADQTNYPVGHFREVYDDLIAPAVEEAGYAPVRADDVHAANLIHLDILKKLIDAPMAVCDLSAVNPNVMFELGIRQAFDKPVVLLKDRTTREIFDIGPIRSVSYDGTLSYRGVNAARDALADAIRATATMKPGDGTNSIVSLLGLEAAAAIKRSDQDPQTARFTLLEKAVAGIAEDLKSIHGMTERIETAETQNDRGGDGRVFPASKRNAIISGNLHKRYFYALVNDLSEMSDEERKKRLRKLSAIQRQSVASLAKAEFGLDIFALITEIEDRLS